MGMRNVFLAGGLILVLCCLLPCRSAAIDPVIIEYFFQTGCEECEKVNAFVLPQLEERFGGRYELRRYDIGELENYRMLAGRQEQLNNSDNVPVSMVLAGRVFLAGYPEIEARLFPELERLSGGSGGHETAAGPAAGSGSVERRAESFTIGAVALAGLIDGVNPCVFATLVFFLSLLAVSKIGGRKLPAVGSVYCIACFLSYLALGFGLFRFLKLFSGYRMLQAGIEWGMTGLLLVFAFLSFRDACRFRRSGRAEDVTLQLPDGIKSRIHTVMRRGLKLRYLLPGAFLIGVLVTVLESVCTGQVYVPTLVLMAREGAGGRWIGLLLLYNLMFILPLLVLFAAACRGVTTPKFIEWSRKNVFRGKLALGGFFVLLAGLMAYLSL